ncbi:hypothetical protein TorRG33x02_019800 [Trema orientale]|uniref:Uncharacterized protein n=1 Tax=Trema orientale TaxID=63057 RepID=A0A2P5FWM1_TREOI|nr:hypothetical protein TorRG33x02_019800 [Trema orientale]
MAKHTLHGLDAPTRWTLSMAHVTHLCGLCTPVYVSEALAHSPSMPTHGLGSARAWPSHACSWLRQRTWYKHAHAWPGHTNLERAHMARAERAWPSHAHSWSRQLVHGTGTSLHSQRKLHAWHGQLVSFISPAIL